MSGEVNFEGLLRETDYEIPVNCGKCGSRLKYVGLGEYKCENCKETVFDDYGKVRTFLEKNPGANGIQVERATGVSRKVIATLIRKGKLDTNGHTSLANGGMDE